MADGTCDRFESVTLRDEICDSVELVSCHGRDSFDTASFGKKEVAAQNSMSMGCIIIFYFIGYWVQICSLVVFIVTLDLIMSPKTFSHTAALDQC